MVALQVQSHKLGSGNEAREMCRNTWRVWNDGGNWGRWATLLLWDFPPWSWSNSFYSQLCLPVGLDCSFSMWQSDIFFPLKKYFHSYHLEICSYILLFQLFFSPFRFTDTDEDTVKRCFATFEEKFFQTCEKELAKINIFYSGKVLICVYLWKMQQHKKSPKLPGFQNSHSVRERSTIR